MSYYQRHLPHWHPNGAAVFVTWRLHGSLPAALDNAVRKFTAFDRELDRAAGPRHLQDERIARAVRETLQQAEQRLRLYRLRAWVIMPNHVHIVIHPEAELWRITQTIKGYSARQANRLLGRSGQPFWQDESYDRWARTAGELEKIVRYVEKNPVKAGLVDSVEKWPWSSATR